MGKQKNKTYEMDKSQSIFRTVKRQNPFVQIDRRIYDDTRLSLKAMGLLGALLSKPNDWVISISNLIDHFKEGKAAIYSAIKDLIKYGYMVRIAHRNEKKQFLYYEYLVFENPDERANFEQNLKIQTSEPFFENLKMGLDQKLKMSSSDLFSENPETENPETENLEAENLETGNLEAGFETPTNNDLTNNDLTNKDLPPCNKDLTSSKILLSPPQKPQRGGEDISILEPIALKLFGQSNKEILEKLRAKIPEFKLDPEVIEDCHKNIDAKEIKANPYSYFGLMYAVATARVSKRNQDLEYQKIQDFIREQYLSDPIDNNKAPAEYIADIKKMFGISPHNKEPSPEPNFENPP